MRNLREIPKTDKILKSPALEHIPPNIRSLLAREKLGDLRAKIAAGESAETKIEAIAAKIAADYERLVSPSLKPLFNATGVALHTNLGRSPISAEIIDEIKPLISGYSNLEYDIENGERGSRYDRVEALLRLAVGCESAIAVNNNAAAVFLVLNTFAAGKEAVVSRGELVEIGGSFRIPEVTRQSGAILREVGATNKTNIADYERAIGENTAILMKVHRSNFAQTGFVGEVSHRELIDLAARSGAIDYYDLGSGQFSALGFGEEPLLSAIPKDASLVSFSGDKLFGAAQAGVIFGKKRLIDCLKRNQSLRMLRVDKITIAVLEATLRRYVMGAENEIAAVAMLRAGGAELLRRAENLKSLLGPLPCEIARTENFAGGGALPNVKIEGAAIAFDGDIEGFEKNLRLNGLIARIEGGRLFIETRALFDRDLSRVAEIIKRSFAAAFAKLEKK